MTLFGNILQNPLDPRAKSDTKLMNLVVNFLSMLGQEAETGGVHRMLGVCSEFERIAKLVIEKGEKEQSSRRKRKSDAAPKTSMSPAASSHTPRPVTASTPTPQTITAAAKSAMTNGQLSPDFNGEANRRRHAFSPMATTSMREPSPALPSAGWPQEFPMPDQSTFGNFAEMTGFGGPNSARSPPMNMGAPFQQPLLPQDLFSLPMTLDWDWAEMSGGAYPTVENGNVG